METPSLPVAVVPSEAATRKHHQFGPSRLEYLDNCAAFTNRQNESSAASDEGTMLHDLMDAIVKQVAAKAYKTCTEQLSDWVTANNELTEDQLAYLRFCCQKLDAIIAYGPVKILSEIEIRVKNMDGSEFNHGFLDVLFIFANGAAMLIDFKFGYIPVPHARINLQGMNYMVGVLQAFPEVNNVGVKLLQPKLNAFSEAVFERKNLYEYYSRLKRVVDFAMEVQAKPDTAVQYTKPGPYCEYCSLAGRCSALANHRAAFAQQYTALPVPAPIASLELSRPEDYAYARYYVDVIEKGLEDFKKRCQEVAELSGGELRCTLPDGQEILYEMRERNADRVLGPAPEIAEALGSYITLNEVMGAAKLSLTALEPIVKNAMVEVKTLNGEKKPTKKACWEEAVSTLEAMGLLSRPDGKIRFLQLKKTQKTIEAGAPPADQNLVQQITQ